MVKVMDRITSNDKLELAQASFEKLASALAEHRKGELPEVVPIVLIGGAALESYGIRQSGEDIDLFIPGEFWGDLDLDEIANNVMQDDPIYQSMQEKIECPWEQQVIEMVRDRDLYTELDNGKFEDLVEPIATLTIDGTRFEFKMPDLATIAFSKSNSFRDKDLMDVQLISQKIGIERIMLEANRLREVHGDARIADFVKDGLSEMASFQPSESAYKEFIGNALSCLELDSGVLLGLYRSFGMDVEGLAEESARDDIWPSDDWEPQGDAMLEHEEDLWREHSTSNFDY